MTCAYYLANLGHEVHVYEAESVAGGVLYWGIPEYRLPKEVLAKEVKAIEQSGVNIHCNVRIGEAISFEELKIRATPSTWRSEHSSREPWAYRVRIYRVWKTALSS